MKFLRNKRFFLQYPSEIDQFHGNNKKKLITTVVSHGRSILRVRSVVSNVVDLFSTSLALPLTQSSAV